VTLFAALAAPPVHAQDTEPGPLFESRDAWIAGAYVLSAAVAFPFDELVAAEIQDSLFQSSPRLKTTARAFNLLGFPGSLVIGGGLYGVGSLAGKDEVADVGLHVTEAILLAEGITYAIKLLAGRGRPMLDVDNAFDFQFGRGIGAGDDFQSFPSGHTSAAFATAAALAHELERLFPGSDLLWGVFTYAPASMVGISRMFDNRHWASDVVFGAAIGAFSGWKVVRYNHENPENFVNRWFLSASFRPGDLSTFRLGIVPRSVPAPRP
jgi:membrane-associated phospholipid phosphatase